MGRRLLRSYARLGLLGLVPAACSGVSTERHLARGDEGGGAGGSSGHASVAGRGGRQAMPVPPVAGTSTGGAEAQAGAGEAGNGGALEAGMGGSSGADAGAGTTGGEAGEWDGGKDPPYVGPAVSELELADQFSCARLENGSVECWGCDVKVYESPDGGSNDTGLIQWPGGPYATSGPEPPTGTPLTQVTYGDGFGCGLRADRTIDCWGLNDLGQATPPEGEFQLISAGPRHACAFGDQVGVVCWGQDSSFQASPPAALSPANSGYTRVVTAGGGIRFAGYWYDDEGEGPVSGPDPGPNTALACGLKSSGRLDCFGDGPRPPAKRFLAASVSERAICAISAEGLECRGRDIETVSVPGKFADVATGTYATCVLETGGKLRCWAPLPGGIALDVPAGTFEQVVVGGTTDYERVPHISALRSDGSIVSFLWNDETGAIERQFDAAGPFKHLAAGNASTCAVEVSGTVVCFDPNSTALGSPVAENAERVAVGLFNLCTLDATGTISCSSSADLHFYDLTGQYPGPFSDFAMGGDYVCGILAAGQGIKCWGSHVR